MRQLFPEVRGFSFNHFFHFFVANHGVTPFRVFPVNPLFNLQDAGVPFVKALILFRLKRWLIQKTIPAAPKFG